MLCNVCNGELAILGVLGRMVHFRCIDCGLECHALARPDYENDDCRRVGLMASCNACDRVIFEHENDMPAFTASGGYCAECRAEVIPAKTGGAL